MVEYEMSEMIGRKSSTAPMPPQRRRRDASRAWARSAHRFTQKK